MSVNNSTAREGDLDRDAAVLLDMAEAVLERFIDPVNRTPVFAVDPTEIVVRHSEANRVPQGQSLAIYQGRLKSLATGARTRIDQGRVSLDLDGIAGGRLWSVPGPVSGQDRFGNDHSDEGSSIPQIVFCSLDFDSPMFVAGEVEAIAIHYLPGTKVVTKNRVADGVAYQVSDDYLEGGYLGVARTYRNLTEANEDREDLSQAIRTYGKESAHCRNDDVFERSDRKAATGSNKIPNII